jgi:hypothetical protein
LAGGAPSRLWPAHVMAVHIIISRLVHFVEVGAAGEQTLGGQLAKLRVLIDTDKRNNLSELVAKQVVVPKTWASVASEVRPPPRPAAKPAFVRGRGCSASVGPAAAPKVTGPRPAALDHWQKPRRAARTHGQKADRDVIFERDPWAVFREHQETGRSDLAYDVAADDKDNEEKCEVDHYIQKCGVATKVVAGPGKSLDVAAYDKDKEKKSEMDHNIQVRGVATKVAEGPGNSLEADDEFLDQAILEVSSEIAARKEFLASSICAVQAAVARLRPTCPDCQGGVDAVFAHDVVCAGCCGTAKGEVGIRCKDVDCHSIVCLQCAGSIMKACIAQEASPGVLLQLFGLPGEGQQGAYEEEATGAAQQQPLLA